MRHGERERGRTACDGSEYMLAILLRERERKTEVMKIRFEFVRN